MSAELRTTLHVAGMFLSIVGAFCAGVLLQKHRPVAGCPDYTVAGQGPQDVTVRTVPSGDMHGGKCVVIRGFFEGPPSVWRYVELPGGKP